MTIVQTPMTPSDSDLIRLAQAGNLSAFEQLVQRYDRRVLTIAASYVRSSDDAKDIYQEVFLRVYRSLKKFQSRSEFSTWLFRITTNVCLTHHSRNKKHRHESLSSETDEEDGARHLDRAVAELTTDTDVNRTEITEFVERALRSLSPRQRLVFTLRHYEGYKLREIAEMMDLAEGSIKKYLFEATARMRGSLTDLHGA